MRTTSCVHSQGEREEMRRRADDQVRRFQWRLVACVTILRTAVTRIIPLAGSAGWWVVPICLLPGVLLYALGALGIRRSDSPGRLAYFMASFALLVDAAGSMTALVTLFTQGIGSQGTQFTLGLVACGMLLFSLNRDGLARGISFLRKPLLLMLALAAAGHLAQARADHIFPVLGGGMPSLWRAFVDGIGMGWVFLLPLLARSEKRNGVAEVLPPVLLCVGVLAAICLSFPHERLIRAVALGDSLVQTVQLPPSLRLVGICLWMGALFLSIGSACSLGGRYLLVPFGRERVWLPRLLAILLSTLQCLPVRGLWQTLGNMEPWLLAALGLGALSCCTRRRE